MTDCVFCKIIQGQIPCFKIYEDESVLSFLDIGPVSDGHTLVIPKQHFETLDSCPSDVMMKLTSTLPEIAAAVKKAMEADGYNVLCNNGRVAGQLVDHVHFHIIPRKEGDGILKGWPSYQYQQGMAEKILEKIVGNL